MIASNRNYPFGSRVTTIHTSQYTCMVSTAKEGFLQKQSTMIAEMPIGQLEPRRLVAKIIYTPSLRSDDRLQMHDLVTKHLNEAGESQSLGTAINSCAKLLKRRGVASEVVNIADGAFGVDAMVQEQMAVISCPKCGQKLRVPSGKDLMVSCSSCRHQFRFKS